MTRGELLKSLVAAMTIQNVTAKNKKTDLNISPSNSHQNSYSIPILCQNVSDLKLKKIIIWTHIKIIFLPNKLEYRANEQIDLTGILVRAYNKDESEWMDIPIEELIVQPARAEFEDLDPAIYGCTSTLDTGTFDQPIVVYYGPVYIEYIKISSPGFKHRVEFTGAFDNIRNIYFGLILRRHSRTVTGFLTAAPYQVGVTGYTETRTTTNLNTGEVTRSVTEGSITTQTTNFGNTAWYGGLTHYHSISESDTILDIWPPHEGYYGQGSTGRQIGNAMWTMIYGAVEKEVTVMWARPKDGVLLTDSFNIKVSSPHRI